MRDPKKSYVGLMVRKTALDDGIGRVKRFDPATGVPFLAHPVTGEELPRPPGPVHFVDLERNRTEDVPENIQLAHHYVGREDWIEGTNGRVVHRPGGPSTDPWAVTHTFMHYDELVLHTDHGDLRYVVVQNPDKRDSAGNPTDESHCGQPGTEVDWSYYAERVA